MVVGMCVNLLGLLFVLEDGLKKEMEMEELMYDFWRFLMIVLMWYLNFEFKLVGMVIK